MRNHSISTPLKLWFKASRYPDQTLGQRIRKARLERGLYQEDLAKLLKVTETTIANWELERTNPIKMYENRIKRCLGVRVTI